MIALPEPRVVAPEVVHEDDWVRVSRLVLEGYARTAPHVHDRPKVTVTVRGGYVRVRRPDGRLIEDILTEPGAVCVQAPGGEPHYLENGDPGRYEAIWIEPAAPAVSRRAGAA